MESSLFFSRCRFVDFAGHSAERRSSGFLTPETCTFMVMDNSSSTCPTVGIPSAPVVQVFDFIILANGHKLQLSYQPEVKIVQNIFETLVHFI